MSTASDHMNKAKVSAQAIRVAIILILIVVFPYLKDMITWLLTKFYEFFIQQNSFKP